MEVEANEGMATVVQSLEVALPQPPTPITAGAPELRVVVCYRLHDDTEMDDVRVRALVDATEFAVSPPFHHTRAHSRGTLLSRASVLIVSVAVATPRRPSPGCSGGRS